MQKKVIQDIKKIKNTNKRPFLEKKDNFVDFNKEKDNISSSQKEEKKIFQKNILISNDDIVSSVKKDNNISDSFKKNNYNPIWFIAILSVIFLLFTVFSLFEKAKIEITPKTEVVGFENKMIASDYEKGKTSLKFSTIVISEKIQEEISALEEYVEDYSKGFVFLYNSFSKNPQKISANTRLEGSNGLIYKTKEDTVIPGLKSDSEPGYVEVEVYALESGSEYNTEPLDFNVVSFKGTNKYDSIYGRSNGIISGGFKGNRISVSEKDKDFIINSSIDKFKDRLFQKAKDEIPSGFVLFDGAFNIKVKDSSVSISDVDKSKFFINLDIILYGILFEEENLTNEIFKYAVNTNTSLNKEDNIFIKDINSFLFKLSNNIDIFDIENTSEIDFVLSGAPTFIWKISKEEVVESLLGKKRKDFLSIMSEFKEINSAEVSLSPFWKKFFPEKHKFFEVNINYPI